MLPYVGFDRLYDQVLKFWYQSHLFRSQFKYYNNNNDNNNNNNNNNTGFILHGLARKLYCLMPEPIEGLLSYNKIYFLFRQIYLLDPHLVRRSNRRSYLERYNNNNITRGLIGRSVATSLVVTV